MLFFAVKLQLQSVGTSLVRIFSKQTCLYVAMAANGKVFTTVSSLFSSGKKNRYLETPNLPQIIFLSVASGYCVISEHRIDAYNKEWRHLNELINKCFLYKTNARMFLMWKITELNGGQQARDLNDNQA